ncbi:MAG: AsmA family protein [Spirochaetota bacterium]
MRALLVLFLLLSAALAGGFFYLRGRISPDRISSEASALLRRKLGFALSIGDIRLTWTGNAELRRICVRNEAMLSERCLFSADIVQLDLRLLPLLRRQLEVRGAQLENCELNFFSETTETPEKKKIIRNSWEGSVPTLAESTAGAGKEGASQISMRMDNLTMKKAVISHEARILPIPLGKTAFSLEVRNAGKRLTLKAELPDSSKVGAELELGVPDFLATARLVATGPRLADADHVSGAIDCERCNLSSLDNRAGFLTGRLQLVAAAKELRIAGEAVQLTTRSAYAPALVWNGTATLALPELYPAGGEGKLAGQGLSLQYHRLAGSAKSGVETDFDAEADLARLPGLTGLKGVVAARGQLRNHLLSANFSLRNLATSAAGLSVTAERLEGALLGSRIAVRQQKLVLSGNAAEVTLEAETGRRPLNLQGSVAFGELNLDALVARGKPADSSQAQPQHAAAGSNPSIKASIQLSAGSLQLGKLKTGPLRAQLYSDGSTTEVRSWQVEFGQGRMQGSYKKQADGQQDLSFRVGAVKVQNLNTLLGFKATVYGTIDADGRLNFSGNSLESVMQTGTGQVSLRLGRGKIRDSFLQKGVLAGPLHKLEEKFSDIEFASAQAEVRLTPNKIQVQKFYFDAEEWNVTYRAESDATWQGKAALAFRFRSSFVENVANPLHMGISDRKDGDFYDLPFACRGAVLTGECYKKNW